MNAEEIAAALARTVVVTEDEWFSIADALEQGTAHPVLDALGAHLIQVASSEVRMVRVAYWQWGALVEHDEQFEGVAEALAFLAAGGVPRYANQVVDFAPEAIIDGDRVIRDADLNRLLAEWP